MLTPAVPEAPSREAPTRRRIRAEVLIVMGLSIGQTAVYATVRLIERYSREVPIGQQVATLNTSQSSVSAIDLTFQLLRIGFGLLPVVLALYLLSSHGHNAWRRLGLTGPASAWWKDVGWGVVLAAAIGIPGLALYAISRLTGTGVQINTSGLPDVWWSIAVLLLAAAFAGILEETLVVGYLLTRLQELGWSVPAAIMTSALLRGAYHLYQGWPMALGNVVMGVVFAYVYVRRGRLAPLIGAHLMLDLVAFVGPEVVPSEWLAELGLA